MRRTLAQPAVMRGRSIPRSTGYKDLEKPARKGKSVVMHRPDIHASSMKGRQSVYNNTVKNAA